MTSSKSLVLRLSGELDASRVDAVLDEAGALLRDAPAGCRLEIDCAGLEFIDSSGLSAMLRMRRAASDAGGTLILRDVPSSVVALLRLSGLQDVLPIA